MNDLGRLIISIVIWVGCVGIAVTTLITNNSIIGVIFPLIMAVAGTVALWGGDNSAKHPTQRRFGPPSHINTKLKRESSYEEKMRLLMEMMDEDERQEFKQMLKRQVLNQNTPHSNLVDGEMPFDMDLDDIFEPDERQRR